MKKSKDIYDLIKTACTVPQIRQLLRECKSEGDEGVRDLIRLSANEDALIATLKSAAARDFVSDERIEQLLKDGEENGNQHIFYFTPKKAETRKRLNEGNAIATLLWGKTWAKSQSFPKLLMLPSAENVPEWGDYRPSSVNGKKYDWLGKLYVLEKRQAFIKDEPEGEGLWKYFEPEFDRNALIVRWNSPDILEIRIHRSQNVSRSALKQRLKSIWEMLAEALDESEFTPWQVTDVVKKLLAELAGRAEAAEKTEHKGESNRSKSNGRESGDIDLPPFVPANLAMLSESGVSATLNSPRGTNFFASRELKGSFAAFNQRNAACRQSATVWQTEPSGGILKDELRILVGGHDSHEIVIRSHVTPEVIDYVTDQLRQIQRRTP